MEFNLDILTKKVGEYYHNEGYTGDWADNAFFIESDGIISLQAPDYTPFMLYGRKAGKMPPIKPIINWCRQYGISASPWAVRYNIGKYGTKGNNFIEKNMNDFTLAVQEMTIESINRELQNIIQ